MKVLYNRYGGLIARCPSCYAILGYTPDDVSTDQTFICPQCQFKIWVPLNPNYDGIIRATEENNSEVT